MEDVKADLLGNKLTVIGKVDSAVVRDKLADKTRKKVEIISPQPKKDSGAASKPPEKKVEEKKTEEKKPADKKTEEKTPKQVRCFNFFLLAVSNTVSEALTKTKVNFFAIESSFYYSTVWF